VLEEVHAEVADQDEEERVRHLRALRQHPHERRRQHEPRPAGDEIAERRQAFLVRGRHEQRPREIRGGRDSHERPLC